MDRDLEILEGYVVDIACLRKYPLSNITSLARDHSKACLLMGHCIESGYGVVLDDGRVALLDGGATLEVVAAVKASPLEKGIRLRAVRQSKGAEMESVEIDQAH